MASKVATQPEVPGVEPLLEVIVASSPDAIFAKDVAGRYLLFNPAAARIAGREAAGVLGHDDIDLFGPDRAARIRDNDRRVMERDQPETYEEELDTPMGRRTFLASKGPLHDAQGGVQGVYGVSRDITEMVETRRSLTQSELRYRQLFKASPLPMWVHVLDTGRFVAVNLAAQSLYGYSRDQFLAMTLADLKAPAAGGERHRACDGRVIEVEIASTEMQVDGKPARLDLIVDVTERHRAEADRRSAAERFEKLFVAAPDPITLSELDTGRFLQVNAAFCTLFGLSEIEVIGRTSTELRLWSQAEGRAQIVERLRAGESVRDFEGVAFHRSGQELDVSFSAERVEVSGRECLLLVFRDITRRKRDEAALRHSEQRFRLAAAAGHVWEWDFGAGGAVPSVEFFRQLGHEVVDANRLAQTFESIVPPEDLAEIKRHLVRHLKQEGPYQVQFRARDAQGQLRWFETQGQAVWDEHGRGTYMAGTTFEISERRRAEQALMDSQAELFQLAQRLLHQERDTHRRLAQSLHDRLGQSLASARLHLDLVREGLGDAAASVARPLDRLSQLVELAIAEVRSTLTALRPPLLEEHGLAASLRTDLADEECGGSEAALVLVVAPEAETQRWSDEVEHAAFMIAREAVSNALLHARASKVQVALSGTAGEMHLSITDDGVGIPKDLQHGRPGHLGLVGMRERALGIGARLQVQRGAGGGTEVLLHWRHRDADAAPIERRPP